MKISGFILLGIVIVLMISGATAYQTFTLGLEYTEMIGTAGLLFAAAAFVISLFTLLATYYQLRKSMAKPKLEVFFTETNNNEKSINVRPIREEKHHLQISVVNKGNAITDMFQISFYIPKIYNPTINYYNVANEDAYYSRHDGDIDVVSFVNKHNYFCFVDMPTPIPSLVLNTYEKEYSNITNELVIPYKIYGDWKETQEGKLKLIINKQEALTHAST